MKSLSSYNKTNSDFYTSLQASLEYPISLNESELLIRHGKNIDSVFYKMNLYNYNISHGGFINESYEDVNFTIDEQFAIRDLLTLVVESYAESLYNEYCKENGIIEEGLFGGVKNVLSKISSKSKEVINKGKDNYNKLVDKFGKLKELLDDIKKKAIKTAKELVIRINDLFISLGCSLMKLFEKLGFDKEECYKEFEQKVGEALKDEKKQKENVYENLGKEYLLINENEYADASTAKSKKEKKGGWKRTIKMMVLQMMAYYGVTIVLPAVVTLIAGPLAGAITACVAKIVWSSATIYKQVKDMRKLYKSGEYQKYSKGLKIFRWIVFWVSIAGSAFGLYKGLEDAWKITEALIKGLGGTVVPDDAVVKLTKWFNEWWKELTGKGDTYGYTELVKAENAKWIEVKEIVSEQAKASQEAQNKFDTHQSDSFKVSETNNFEHTRKNGQDELANWGKELSEKTDLKGSMKMLEYIKGQQVSTNGVTTFIIDGQVLGGNRAEFINKIAAEIGVKASDIDISQLTNTALQQSTNGAAGSVFQVILKGDATKEMINSVETAVSNIAKSMSGSEGFCHVLSKTVEAAATVTQQIAHPMNLVKTAFAAFGGLFPVALKSFPKGGFLLRMGSKTTGNKLYFVESIDDVKEIEYSKAKSEYGNNNPKVFDKMDKIVNDNYKSCKDYIKKKQSDSSLSKKEKKRLEALDKQIEEMQKGSKEYKPLIIFGKVWNKKEKKAEGDKIPLVIFNPMIIACGDLASGKKSGPRANPYYIKGLFSRLESIPVDGGASKEEIIKFWGKMSLKAIQAAWNMTPDVPCYKDGKKYVENTESEWKGKNRPDFGNFTNTELTEIFNNPKEETIAQYFGGQHADDSLSGGKHLYNEKTDTNELKAHNEKKLQQYKNEIETNKEIKELINNSKTLKKKLVDDNGNVKDEELEKISKELFRIENNYLKGEKKKGFFRKIKDFFTDKRDYDPEEVYKLSLKLAEVLKNKRNKKNEDFEDDYYNIILESNYEIIERELLDYLKYNIINEDLEEDDFDDILI